MNAQAAKPKSYLLEVMLGLGVLIAVNLLWWPDDPAFGSLKLHPYWLVILPMAVDYGFREGAISAAVCAGVYVIWNWMTSTESHWLLFFNMNRLAVPVVFIAAGLFLGELRERHRRREMALKERLTKVEEGLQDLSVKHMSLVEANQELELRIISQDQTAQTLYQAAEGLEQLDEDNIYPAVADLLVDYLGVQAASVYLLREDHFERVAVRGRLTDDQAPLSISSDQGLMAGALTKRRVVTVKMILSQKELPSFQQTPILISAPLILDRGEVAGIINVHRLPFVRFNPATVRMAALLAGWASIALSNARRFKEVADRNIDDELTGAYTPKYLSKRLKEEFSRSKRYDMRLSCIMIKIRDFDEIHDLRRADILTVLGGIFSKSVRDSDMVFRYSGPDTFVLLLPATPLVGTKVLARRLLADIVAFKFKPYTGSHRQLDLLVGLAEVNAETATPEDFMAAAESNLAPDVEQ